MASTAADAARAEYPKSGPCRQQGEGLAARRCPHAGPGRAAWAGGRHAGEGEPGKGPRRVRPGEAAPSRRGQLLAGDPRGRARPPAIRLGLVQPAGRRPRAASYPAAASAQPQAARRAPAPAWPNSLSNQPARDPPSAGPQPSRGRGGLPWPPLAGLRARLAAGGPGGGGTGPSRRRRIPNAETAEPRPLRIAAAAAATAESISWSRLRRARQQRQRPERRSRRRLAGRRRRLAGRRRGGARLRPGSTATGKVRDNPGPASWASMGDDGGGAYQAEPSPRGPCWGTATRIRRDVCWAGTEGRTECHGERQRRGDPSDCMRIARCEFMSASITMRLEQDAVSGSAVCTRRCLSLQWRRAGAGKERSQAIGVPSA